MRANVVLTAILSVIGMTAVIAGSPPPDPSQFDNLLNESHEEPQVPTKPEVLPTPAKTFAPTIPETPPSNELDRQIHEIRLLLEPLTKDAGAREAEAQEAVTETIQVLREFLDHLPPQPEPPPQPSQSTREAAEPMPLTSPTEDVIEGPPSKKPLIAQMEFTEGQGNGGRQTVNKVQATGEPIPEEIIEPSDVVPSPGVVPSPDLSEARELPEAMAGEVRSVIRQLRELADRLEASLSR